MFYLRLFTVLAFLSIKSNSFGQIFKIEETKNYDEISLKKLTEAIRLLDSVLVTENFKTRVLNAKFVGTKGKSNQEIYDYLMSGNSPPWFVAHETKLASLVCCTPNYLTTQTCTNFRGFLANFH